MVDDEDDALEQLRQDPTKWVVDQELDVAAEVYDPNRRNIHELEGEEMLDRFRTLLGFDVSWGEPPRLRDLPPDDLPPDDLPSEEPPPDESG